ncbi:hypothetical protein DQ04_01321000 [Trypanosoma grayi]|uniref:hypothetical protein n=1 Tax=Trypanosoma grayi TaxID=71804 RepID=UPI0004F40176|nr:hypothetical protein DQ04_01321000 [Trypanosoma grayi]KEG12927.1 hypothetical protein DQ04_01321000 [Trypanosoma grayi]
MAKEEARRERMYLLAEQSAGLNSSFSGSSVSCRSSQLPDRHQQQQQQQMFKPHITEYAKRLRRPGNVVDRLLVEGSCRRRAEQGESCSFAPRVAPASTEISKNFYTDPNVLVHERLYRNKVSKSSEMRRKQLISEAEGELTGIPRISETSRIIMERKRAEETELQQSPAGRLHYIGGVATQNGKEKPQSRGAKENNEEEGCTFQPRINTVSERMWRRQLQLLQEDGYARTAAEARELLWRRSQKRMETEIQRRRELEATKEMTECTFRPRVGRSPERHIERGLSVSERNERWRQQRERRLRQVKQELERTQLSECSFHPTVDPLFPLPVQDAAPVSGYEAHVLRQEKSRRRKHEAEEWWRPKKRVENRNALGKALSSSSPHQRWQQQEEKERQYWDGSRSLSSPLSREASSSDVESTQFVVYQAPSCVSSVPPRSSSLTPQHSGVGAMVQSVKPSPVDFIINHHRAIVESARRR